MLVDKLNVEERFHAKSPSLVRCKEGYLPLLNFSNLACMVYAFSDHCWPQCFAKCVQENSNRTVCLSLSLFVCNSILLTYKVQYLIWVIWSNFMCTTFGRPPSWLIIYSFELFLQCPIHLRREQVVLSSVVCCFSAFYINILFNLHQTCAGQTLFEVGMLLYSAYI